MLEVDPVKRRISLGLKQTLPTRGRASPSASRSASMVEGEVKNKTEFGLFIGLDGDVDGMVHLSDLDWNRPGEQVIDDFKKGDMVKAQVLDVDVEKERISLGIKQLAGDPFVSQGRRESRRAPGDLRKGAVVTCEIIDVKDGGVDVKIVGTDLTCFVKRTELARDRNDQRPERFAVGEKVDARITLFDRKARKVAVSIKALEDGRGEGSHRPVRLGRFRRVARRHPRRGAQARSARRPELSTGAPALRPPVRRSRRTRAGHAPRGPFCLLETGSMHARHRHRFRHDQQRRRGRRATTGGSSSLSWPSAAGTGRRVPHRARRSGARAGCRAPCSHHVGGPQALERALRGYGHGRFVQSIKTYLGSRAFTETRLFGQRFTIEDLVATFLGHLRRRTATALLADASGVVAGRPVVFAGDKPDEALAVEPPRHAFAQAGFGAVDLAYEPLGAAYWYARDLKRDETVLVADFGGGTSDFSVIRFTAAGGRLDAEPLAHGGVGVAGDTFDYRLIDHFVAPQLGKGSHYRSFDKLPAVPGLCPRRLRAVAPAVLAEGARRPWRS